MFQLLCVGVNYLVFLEGFKCPKRASRNVARLVVTEVTSDSRSLVGLVDRCMAFNKVNPVSVNNAMIAAPNPKVVGDEFNWSFERGCHPRLSRTVEHRSTLFISGVMVLV